MGHNGVLRARRDVENEIRGLTLVDWLRETAEEEADAPALSDHSDDGWTTVTWRDYRQSVLELASAYIDTGVLPGDVVA